MKNRKNRRMGEWLERRDKRVGKRKWRKKWNTKRKTKEGKEKKRKETGDKDSKMGRQTNRQTKIQIDSSIEVDQGSENKRARNKEAQLEIIRPKNERKVAKK